MTLPFLKNKEGSLSLPVETKERAHDEGYDLLDAIADDILMAVEKKDKGALKAALESLCEHVKAQDDDEPVGEHA